MVAYFKLPYYGSTIVNTMVADPQYATLKMNISFTLRRLDVLCHRLQAAACKVVGPLRHLLDDVLQAAEL